jgi:hypothetical protein
MVKTKTLEQMFGGQEIVKLSPRILDAKTATTIMTDFDGQMLRTVNRTFLLIQINKDGTESYAAIKIKGDRS